MIGLRRLFATLGLIALLLLPWSHDRKNVVSAAAVPLPRAQVSFTFDDGYASTFTKAAPILGSQGFAGTVYPVTNFVGQNNYLTWDQLTQLQKTNNWEIGSHTVSHPLLTEVSAAQLDQELRQSKEILQAKGFNPLTIASPYGDYNPPVIDNMAKYYAAHRGFHDTGYNSWPNNNYLLYVQQVQVGVSLNKVKSYINQAKSSGRWLILVFHDIKDNPSQNKDDYEYSTANLRTIVDYVKSRQLPVVTVEQGLVKGSPNLMPNPTFENGINNGWTTDDTSRFKLDTANHGSYPSPEKSISFTGSSKNIHLFSPKIAVNASSSYGVKSYLNLTKVDNSVVAYFIDEYDANGNWVSGQYKAQEGTVFAEQVAFTYKPSSSKVKQSSLQFIVGSGSGATGYIDSVEWFALN